MSDPIISEAKLEKALNFLAESDAEYAQKKADLERSEIFRKRVRARLFLVSEGTVADRNAIAETGQDSEAADEGYLGCLKVFETLRAQRQRAEIVIDVWRSLEASRRRG